MMDSTPITKLRGRTQTHDTQTDKTNDKDGGLNVHDGDAATIKTKNANTKKTH